MTLRRRTLPGTDLRLSTFCCGLGDLFSLPQDQSDKVLDAFVEADGNFFDSAHVYSFWLSGGNGLSEISIGDYIRRRGLENAVIATKGGHPSALRYRIVEEYLSPARVSADIDDSLARLECDTISLYYLHRDDPRVPVDEIIEALNLEIRRGRIRYIGASNWSVERIAEANEYARAKRLASFVISQPRWSLADYKSTPDLNTGEEISWHRQTGFPVAPYSPTAHGFFAGRDTEEYSSSPGNQRRRERATELAKKYDATPNQIALAWLLNHPFPVFPILGTKSPQRLQEALEADALRLTEEELLWLEQG
jgi:aryl-alcohol dehydrogenase-like predicted oxidoreductase